jgi:hypothetical protein
LEEEENSVLSRIAEILGKAIKDFFYISVDEQVKIDLEA